MHAPQIYYYRERCIIERSITQLEEGDRERRISHGRPALLSPMRAAALIVAALIASTGVDGRQLVPASSPGAATLPKIKASPAERPRDAAATRATRDLPEAKVRVSPVGSIGMGVFAVEAIPQGRWVCSYVGVLSTNAECDDRYRGAGHALSPGEGDYLFRIDDDVCMDAQNSTHHSRFFNHDEHGNLDVNVTVDERRVDFWALRDVAAGEQLTFDYGMAYWRHRDGPLESTDSRDYSDAAWRRRDVEASRLCNRFPLPVGAEVPLTPVRPIEVQAALMLPEAQCRPAMLRALEFFGATRAGAPAAAPTRPAHSATTASAGARAAASDDGSTLTIPFGVKASSLTREVDPNAVSIDEHGRHHAPTYSLTYLLTLPPPHPAR
jgi:hypothetical protein